MNKIPSLTKQFIFLLFNFDVNVMSRLVLFLLFFKISKKFKTIGFKLTICLNLFNSPYSSLIENLGKLYLFSLKLLEMNVEKKLFYNQVSELISQ